MTIEKRHFTCVICPIGCEIDVELANGDIVSMEGNKCAKAGVIVRDVGGTCVVTVASSNLVR